VDICHCGMFGRIKPPFRKTILFMVVVIKFSFRKRDRSGRGSKEFDVLRYFPQLPDNITVMPLRLLGKANNIIK